MTNKADIKRINRILQVAPPVPVICPLKLEVGGAVLDRDLHVRAFDHYDEKWKAEKWGDHDIFKDVIERTDMTKWVELFLHQIVEEDLSWMIKNIPEVNNEDELKDWLMRQKSDPYGNNICEAIFATVFEVWGNSFPHPDIDMSNVGEEVEIEGGKKLIPQRNQPMTIWSYILCVSLGVVLTLSLQFWGGHLYSLLQFIWN